MLKNRNAAARKVAVNQLPSPTTTFIGRQRDLEAIASWFSSGRRLVSIVGPPGMGKTRVAIEYASTVIDRAACFCNLAEVHDLDGLNAHIAACLGLSLGIGVDVGVSIGLALREGRPLLVLDNFEQLVDVGAATVARWLTRAPDAQILVTSRERLYVDGEVVHELEPLSLDSDAIELFVDRAKLMRRDFAVTDGDAPVVAEIVRRLDGIPLAIEIAAARMDVMAPATLVERMQRRLDLVGGRRDASARQATLRGAIDGSWDALPAFARIALAQVSLFRGGFTLEAAEAVIDLSSCADAPPIVGALGVLRAKSLLRMHGAPELRFSLYEVIRDYARDKLAISGDAAAARERCGRYFVERFTGRSVAPRELVPDRNNLIAVLEGVLAAPVTTETTCGAAMLLLALDPVLPRSGPSSVHLGWLDAVLARPPAMLDPTMRANVLLARGRALLARGRFGDSVPSLMEVIPIAHELRDPRLEARALIGLGVAHHRRRRDDVAKPAFERALELLAGRDGRRESITHGYLGGIAQEAERMHEARTHLRDALRVIETSDPNNRAFQESTIRLRLGLLALDEGNPAEAQLEGERATELAVRIGSRRLHGLGEGFLALANWLRGELADADDRIARSVQMLAAAGDQESKGFALAIHGAILAARDRIDDSAAAFEAAEATLAAIGDVVGLAAAAIYHGHLDLARARRATSAGDEPRAAAHRAEAERRATQELEGSHAIPPRVATRTLRRALDQTAPDDGDVLLVDRDRRSIRMPGRVRWVPFGRQAVPWRLLVEMCEMRLRSPSQPVAPDALIEAGWPGQTVSPRSAQNRLHVAINALRKLGLRRLIVTHDDGYLLTPSVRVRWVASS